MKTSMYKYKNYLLFSLIFLSQIHVLFRGVEFDIEWILNGRVKNIKTTIFLFAGHFSEFILVLCLMKPKGLDKNLVLFFLIITSLDVVWFLMLSGVGGEIYKIFLSLLIFALTKSKYNKWLK